MHVLMRTNWFILKTCLQERLVYRGDFLFSMFIRFLPVVTQVFLWRAIYSGGGLAQKINGYDFSEMVSYTMLAMVARAFSSMPGLTTGIAREIRDGSIKKYLTQPIDMMQYFFLHRVAHKLVYYLVATLPFAFMFWVLRDYFRYTPGMASWCGFVISLAFAFLVGFLLESLMGLVAFWFLEVSSLVFIFTMLNFFLSGHMLPLDWMGDFGTALQYLPFQYLAYFPASILLGKCSGDMMVQSLIVEAIWIVGLLLANRWAFQRGVKHYSAFGG
ncbi:MAG: ABC-2 family transporter protein [Planctomycetota bacterium]|nr:ABC-2 family transporter protein [Planctomycetota bacterium]